MKFSRADFWPNKNNLSEYKISEDKVNINSIYERYNLRNIVKQCDQMAFRDPFPIEKFENDNTFGNKTGNALQNRKKVC